MSEKKLRILIAEDHLTVREGVKLLVNAQPDMEVVGEGGGEYSGGHHEDEHDTHSGPPPEKLSQLKNMSLLNFLYRR